MVNREIVKMSGPRSGAAEARGTREAAPASFPAWKTQATDVPNNKPSR